MVFLRARQIQSRNKSHKSGAVEKKDGAGSLAESHFSGQSRIKSGESTDQALWARWWWPKASPGVSGKPL